MRLGFNTSTLRVHFNSATNRVCEGCCPVFLPVVDGCCCFHDPSPSAWSAIITYNTGDMASHGGTDYYSKSDGNLNNTPPHATWGTYTACGNEDWNSFPPYGGVGKTPKYYLVSSRIVGLFQFYGVNAVTCVQTLWTQISYTLDVLSLLTGGDPSCIWGSVQILHGHVSYTYVSGLGTVSCTSTTTPTVQFVILRLDNPASLSIHFNFTMNIGNNCDSGSITCGLARLVYPECSGIRLVCPSGNPQSLPDCDISGTIIDSNSCTIFKGGDCPNTISLYESKDETHSWRPFDCNYTMWDSSEIYSVNNCVFWKGKYYLCILSHSNQEPPNATYWTDIS